MVDDQENKPELELDVELPSLLLYWYEMRYEDTVMLPLTDSTCSAPVVIVWSVYAEYEPVPLFTVIVSAKSK